MWPWRKTDSTKVLQAEIGSKIVLTLPGGKQRYYLLTSMSFSQGGNQVDMTLLSEGMVKEKYWIGG